MVALQYLLAATAVLAGSLASPIATHTEGKRSTTSAGVTCYFQCPTTVDYEGNPAEYYNIMSAGPGRACLYGIGGSDGSCVYGADDGVLTSADTGLTCPNDLGSPICSSTVDRSFKKRSQLEIQRDLKRSQKGYDAIATRQYKPRK